MATILQNKLHNKKERKKKRKEETALKLVSDMFHGKVPSSYLSLK